MILCSLHLYSGARYIKHYRNFFIAPAASVSERGGILALPHVRDAGIFFQLIVFFFSQEKENQVFYFMLKLC